MPRVNLAGDVYLDKDLSSLIKRYKYGNDLNNAEAGMLIGIGERTFAKYLEQPDKIPLHILRKIQRNMHIPKEEFLRYLL